MSTSLQQRLDRYRTELDELSAEINDAYFLHGVGLSPTLDLEKYVSQHPYLFEPNNADLGKEYLAAANGEEQAQARRLLGIILGNLQERETLPLVEEFYRREAAATVELDGKPVSYRYSTVLMVNEADRARRRHISELQDSVMLDLQPLTLKGYDALEDFLGRHGYAGYQDYYFTFNEVNYHDFAAPTRLYLEQTTPLYDQLLADYCPKLLGIAPDELEGHDLAYLRRGGMYDHLFPAGRLREALDRSLAGLGIDLAAQTNIHIDLEVREGKMPRAFCCPVRIPDDVRIMHLPQGGPTDYHTTFHEMGHAEHFAHSDGNLPAEFRHKGDRGITEGHAFILQSLIYDPLWLEQFLGVTDQDFIRFNFFTKFMLHRSLCTRSLYELELRTAPRTADGHFAGMPERYVDIHRQYMRLSARPQRYLQVDEGYYTADYVRAWFFECQLRQFMRDQFQPDWWNSPEAGDFLKRLWHTGRKLSVDEAGRDFLGGQSLRIEPLRDEFASYLGA